ncbi:MAG: AAA family ATPase, partial [Deltaproteobacteria bacterium]|nr:AAA family ATPase [Deltaproteobacteria bacterium]
GGIQPSDGFFHYSVKKGVRLDDPQWREVLEWEIRSFRPEFVYLDVFTRLHAKNINDPAEMGEIVLFLDHLNREYNCTIIILHHTRKNNAGGDDHDEIIGSRVLGGFAEATLFFSKTKEKGVLRVRVALKDEPEDGSFEPEFLIRLTDTPDQKGTQFEYLGVPPEKTASLELREKIKNFVLGRDKWVKVKEVAEGTGCSKPTARDHLDALTDLKVLARGKEGSAYVYGPS